MKNKSRFIAVLFCFVLLISILCIPAAAAEDTSADISNMNDNAMKYYRSFGRIIVFFAIVSLASCGYKILAAVFIGGEANMAKVKKQILYTLLAIIIYISLPRVFGYVIGLVSASAWKPSPPANNPWIDILD